MSIYRSLNSGSNIFRRRLCPGSASAEEGLPDVEQNNIFAAKGTQLHAIEAADSDFTEELTAGLKQLEKRALDKNKRLSDEFVAKVLAFNNIGEPGDCLTYRERDFYLSQENGEPVAPLVVGHADEVRYYPSHNITFVFDSKFGTYPVTPADSNLQLGLYTICAHDDIGGEKFYAAIRQPFLKSPLDFHHVEYLKDDIRTVRAEILDIIAATENPDAPRIPSIDACWFCRAQGTPRCPESQVFLDEVKRAKVLTMKPAELEAMGEKVGIAEVICKSWHLRLKYIMDNYPAAITKYEFGTQQQVHSIPDPVLARERIFQSGLLGDDLQEADKLFLSCCDVSIPKLREAAAKKKGIPESQAAQEVFSLGVHSSKPKERSIKKKK